MKWTQIFKLFWAMFLYHSPIFPVCSEFSNLQALWHWHAPGQCQQHEGRNGELSMYPLCIPKRLKKRTVHWTNQHLQYGQYGLGADPFCLLSDSSSNKDELQLLATSNHSNIFKLRSCSSNGCCKIRKNSIPIYTYETLWNQVSFYWIPLTMTKLNGFVVHHGLASLDITDCLERVQSANMKIPTFLKTIDVWITTRNIIQNKTYMPYCIYI